MKKFAIQYSKISAIVSSDWMLEKVKKSPIWKGKKIYKLPLGVDQNIFKPTRKNVRENLKISDNDFVLFFRSEEDSFKGLDIIKKALDDIVSKKKITILTVGTKGNLNEYKSKYNLIEFGWVNDDNVLAQLYQSCDLFLMPSRQETFGMMAIEAMSCGKTILALDCPGSALRQIINSPNASIAVKEEEYTKMLQKLIDDKILLETHDKKSLEYAKSEYSRDKYIEGMIKIYKEEIEDFEIDAEAEIILEQLKQYRSYSLVLKSQIDNEMIFSAGTNKPQKTIRYYYRKLPLRLRRINKKIIVTTGKTISKVIPGSKKVLKQIKKKLYK